MAHTHPVIDRDTHFIIDPITRAVTNAESKKTILMQNDHNSERFTFEIDKQVEGHDMTKCNKVEIHYTNEDSNKKNKNAGVYEVTDMQASADNTDKLVFSWLVSENATLYAGSLRFLVVFSCVEKGEVAYRWNTNINASISISKGMNNGEALEEAYPDILTQWKDELFAAIYGMETTHVGPTEPEEFPYIWFDTSEYIGSSDPYIGVLTIKDAEGNKHVLYPFAKLAGTDGANLEAKFDAQTEIITDIQNKFPTKVDKTSIANNLSTTEEGYVLDARQGNVLKDEVDAKLPLDGGTMTGDMELANSAVVLRRNGSDNYVTIRCTDTDGGRLTLALKDKDGVIINQFDMTPTGWYLRKALEINDGGTGATTAAAARANLGAVAMKTATASLPVASWSSNAQTVSVSGVTASNTVIVTAAPASYEHYNECAVRCSAQAAGTLTFTCTDTPTSALTVNVLILE